MTSRNAALLLIVGLGMGAAVEVQAGQPETVRFDKSFALPDDGRDVIPVELKAGELVVDEILLSNLPRKDEVRVAVANDSDDKCRPKIAVVFNNPTPYKMKAKVVASFEGADGTVYMSCKRKDRINGLDDSNRTDVCFGLGALTSMQLRNWPKVTKVHIEADISRDK